MTLSAGPRRKILAVCSFFAGDSLVQSTVETFADAADLYLVPVEPDAPVPEIAEPFLATRRLGIEEKSLRPCKKWRTVNAVLDRVDLGGYDYAIFPDDDLEYSEDFARRFFDLLDRYDVALAQPALTADSYHTYDISMCCPDAILRYTNFVEVMIPCFRRDCLRLLRGTFAADISPMGYGFDLHWPYPCSAAGFKMAIVDDTPVAHRFRPTGKHYAGDDLHNQGYEYGRRFPRILTHEQCELGRVPRPAVG
jgi:hypothetical protein